MKILFVSSGRAGATGHVVKNQGESLKIAGLDIEYLTIKPGIGGYLFAVRDIRKRFRKENVDLVHAHYSLSAFSATMAGVRPLVVSLMGSDAFAPLPVRFLIKFLSSRRWDAIIVKTKEMKSLLNLSQAHILPNGVDTERFDPMDKVIARGILDIDVSKKLILFVSVKNRPEKNLSLAIEAVTSLEDNNVELLHLYDKPNTEIPLYLNAADLLLLTSAREGGVNVIKEAMACNCPIVSTDVGDVRYVTEGTEGCFITSSDPGSISEGIRQALSFGRRTNGRDRIFKTGLDSVTVSSKIKDIYRAVLNKKRK